MSDYFTAHAGIKRMIEALRDEPEEDPQDRALMYLENEPADEPEGIKPLPASEPMPQSLLDQAEEERLMRRYEADRQREAEGSDNLTEEADGSDSARPDILPARG